MFNREVTHVFAALGDPTRTGIVELLAAGGSLRISELSDAFQFTRQTVTRHLDILCDAGITVSEWQGRERYTRLSDHAFDSLLDWMRHYDRFWDEKLADLKSLVEEEIKQ